MKPPPAGSCLNEGLTAPANGCVVKGSHARPFSRAVELGQPLGDSDEVVD